MVWGKVEYDKNGESIFKLTHLELEFDYANLPEKDLINYGDFLNKKYKLKSETEIPILDERNIVNEEIK